MRVLGEMTWMPTAFLDERYVSWEAVDDRRARATLNVGSRSVTLTFTFDDEDMPTRIDALRWRDICGGNSELTPWTAKATEFSSDHGNASPGSRISGMEALRACSSSRFCVDIGPSRSERCSSFPEVGLARDVELTHRPR